MFILMLLLTLNFNDIQITEEYLTRLEDTIKFQKDVCCELYYNDKIDSIVAENIRKICNRNLILILQCTNIYQCINECQTDTEQTQFKRDYMNLIYVIQYNINKVELFLKFGRLKITRF